MEMNQYIRILNIIAVILLGSINLLSQNSSVYSYIFSSGYESSASNSSMIDILAGQPATDFVSGNNSSAEIGFLYQPLKTTGIEVQTTKEYSASVYPNPAVEYVIIKFDIVQPGNFRFVVTNLVGEIEYYSEKGVLPAGEYQLKLELNNFSESIYSYRIYSGDRITAGKFIKLK